MSGHGEKLTRKKEQAILALLTERTVAEAAAATGVSEATLTRWMKLQEFGVAYREARREAVSMAIARVQSACTGAVEVLQHVMHDDQTPPSVRVSAAKTILDTTFRAAELEDLSVRVMLLERAAGLRG